MRYWILMIGMLLVMDAAYAQPHIQTIRQIQATRKNVAINPVIKGSEKTKISAGGSRISGKAQPVSPR